MPTTVGFSGSFGRCLDGKGWASPLELGVGSAGETIAGLARGCGSGIF